MKLVQFNPRIIPSLKIKVRRDAVETLHSNNTIASAVIADFFQRYPTRKEREEIYEKMRLKIEANAPEAEGGKDLPAQEAVTTV